MKPRANAAVPSKRPARSRAPMARPDRDSGFAIFAGMTVNTTKVRTVLKTNGVVMASALLHRWPILASSVGVGEPPRAGLRL